MNAGRNADGLKLAEGRAKTEKSARNAVIAATIGNMMETYDFAVYGYFAPEFYPVFSFSGQVTKLFRFFSLVATFGVGFFARPHRGSGLGNVGGSTRSQVHPVTDDLPNGTWHGANRCRSDLCDNRRHTRPPSSSWLGCYRVFPQAGSSEYGNCILSRTSARRRSAGFSGAA